MAKSSWAREQLKKYSRRHPQLLRAFQRVREQMKERKFAACQRENPVDEKLVVFESYWGQSYSCSPKALYEGMLADRRFQDFQFIWSFEDVEAHSYLLENPRTRLVKRNSNEYHKAFAQAKYWIYNMSIPEYMTPGEDQVYVETWHGTPLKRIGCDTIYESDYRRSRGETIAAFEKKGAKVTYLLSPSVFYDQAAVSAFGLEKSHNEKAVVPTGYPRNDYLFHYKEEDRQRIRERLGIPKGRKVLLYTPTWRENQHEERVGFTYRTELDLQELFRILGEEYVLLYRSHHHVKAYELPVDLKKQVIDVTKVEDINELYIVSDMLITDYSSTLFDYANLGRPMIFFMYDLEEYQNHLRGFYFDIEELPGPVVKSTKELAGAILEYGRDFHYTEKYQEFRRKFNTYDDGGAVDRTLNLLWTGSMEKGEDI